MRKTRKLVLMSSVIVVWFVFFVLVRLTSSESPPVLSSPSAQATLIDVLQVKEVQGYRNWTRVNPEPVYMNPVAATACAAPVVARRTREEGSPHAQRYITVYVNDVGRRAMMKERKPRFPEGSVIVKEKLLAKDSATPELLTVMIKRAKGFNPASGDWEYMVTNGAGSEVQARGKLSSCQSCHTPMTTTDYIYRSYLPGMVQDALR